MQRTKVTSFDVSCALDMRHEPFEVDVVIERTELAEPPPRHHRLEPLGNDPTWFDCRLLVRVHVRRFRRRKSGAASTSSHCATWIFDCHRIKFFRIIEQ
jgi:hypothetical protein